MKKQIIKGSDGVEYTIEPIMAGTRFLGLYATYQEGTKAKKKTSTEELKEGQGLFASRAKILSIDKETFKVKIRIPIVDSGREESYIVIVIDAVELIISTR